LDLCNKDKEEIVLTHKLNFLANEKLISRLRTIVISLVISLVASTGALAGIFGATATRIESADPTVTGCFYFLLVVLFTYHFACRK